MKITSFLKNRNDGRLKIDFLMIYLYSNISFRFFSLYIICIIATLLRPTAYKNQYLNGDEIYKVIINVNTVWNNPHFIIYCLWEYERGV